MLAVFPFQLGLHNFNFKSCSLMLNPKTADFLLRRKRKWKQGRTKEDQQGFNILGGCSWGEKHKEGRRRSRFIGDRIESRVPFTLKSFLFSSIFFLLFSFQVIFKFFCINSFNFSSYFNSINKKRSWFQFSDLESLCFNFYFLVKDLFQLHVLG